MALRLVFEHDGPSVRLVSTARVDAVAPPSDSLESFEGRSGFWYELTDGGTALLYRRVTQNPLGLVPEIFDVEGAPTRASAAESSGAFSVLIPEVDGARQIALVGSPPGAEAIDAAATVLAVFDLTEGPIA